jgi:hypothetical protein
METVHSCGLCYPSSLPQSVMARYIHEIQLPLFHQKQLLIFSYTDAPSHQETQKLRSPKLKSNQQFQCSPEHRDEGSSGLLGQLRGLSSLTPLSTRLEACDQCIRHQIWAPEDLNWAFPATPWTLLNWEFTSPGAWKLWHWAPVKQSVLIYSTMSNTYLEMIRSFDNKICIANIWRHGNYMGHHLCHALLQGPYFLKSCAVRLLPPWCPFSWCYRPVITNIVTIWRMIPVQCPTCQCWHYPGCCCWWVNRIQEGFMGPKGALQDMGSC